MKLTIQAIMFVVFVAVLLRLGRDEKLIGRLRETNLAQNEWNKLVKADDFNLRKEYALMWKDQQKCHPILGAQDRDVFCHGLKCWYLKNTEVEATQ